MLCVAKSIETNNTIREQKYWPMRFSCTWLCDGVSPRPLQSTINPSKLSSLQIYSAKVSIPDNRVFVRVGNVRNIKGIKKKSLSPLQTCLFFCLCCSSTNRFQPYGKWKNGIAVVPILSFHISNSQLNRQYMLAQKTSCIYVQTVRTFKPWALELHVPSLCTLTVHTRNTAYQ